LLRITNQASGRTRFSHSASGISANAVSMVDRMAVRAGEIVLIQLIPVFDERRFTLNNMCDAYRTIRAGAARGKLAVDMAASNA
jgi:hypothetical protein